jgi:alkylation response protein AidB-like acyl-CoA dehydrogenase
MDFGLAALTPAQETFAEQVRAFLAETVTGDVLDAEHETGDGFNERVHLALGARGWLTPDWPAADGGAGLDEVCCWILQRELARHHVPMITAGTTALISTATAGS